MKKLLFFSIFALTSLIVQAQVTYTVTVPTGTNKCYIAGSMTGWTFLEMTEVTPTSYTVFIPTATTADTYKYLSGPGWAWEEVQADCSSSISDRSYAINDVVACWRIVFDPAVVPQDYVYNVTVPSGTNKCYIVGSFTNWSFLEMTKLTETSYTITVNTTTPNAYKFSSGPNWAWLEMQADCVSDIDDRTYAENNVVACWKAIYDPATVPQDYIYNVTVPAGTHKCYFAGNATNWSHTEMTKLTETTYTLTISTTTPNGYKFCSGPSWNYEELQADGSGVSNRDYNQENTVALWREVFTPTVTTVLTPSAPVLVKGVHSGIHIEISGQADVAVYSLQGNLLKQTQVTNRALIPDLNAGVYLLRMNGITYKAIVH